MHQILFKNCENSWKNALPLGNGVFGAMAFYKDNALSLPLNHYEVYYTISDSVLPKDILRDTPQENDPGAIHRKYYTMAEHNQPGEDGLFFYYRSDKTLWKPGDVSFFESSYPATGELKFELPSECKDKDTRLRLDIEKARVCFSAGETKIKTIVAREDLLINEISGKIKALKIEYPDSRRRDFPIYILKAIDEKTFAYTVKIALNENDSLRFAGIIRLNDAKGHLEENRIIIDECADTFTVMTGIFTSWQYLDPLMDGLKLMDAYGAELRAIYERHEKYWDEFFARSGIRIPDKFLERVYYINQYALDCSSGKDGVMKHHACGLNGLWDIRHPNLWGSMWYWDVNIQAAFAGVFSSNRLDLGKVFSDGLLTYVELAERFAKDVHDMRGAAIDYPYHFYFSTWPWCAQYLWAQYEYSQDKEYLKNEAYPVFLKLCDFSADLFKWDEKRGEFVVYPDISPEQGPLTHNSVITVASVKYLLKFTLEAAEILGDDNEILDRARKLLAGLPAYPIAEDQWGKRFKDSEDAPKDLWIRHPSMLMPIFPTGEIDIESSEELRDIAINSVKFLEENCEIGVFQVSWLAAVAARMGDGQRALRLLYEMGMDHLLRSNGLAAEENERFMNFCLICRQPLYYPCMMEFTGEMLAAVNEMLMQSNGGIIRLFPAMPNGDPEYDRLHRRGQPINDYTARYRDYPAWNDAAFDKLLARGAFEVSSELCDGKLIYLKITSNAGGKVRITSPYALDTLLIGTEYSAKDNVLEFETEKGESYEFGAPSQYAEKEEEIISHLSYTKRNIFLGEDEHSEYQRALDSFTRDWYLGNVRLENHSVYRLDLGACEEKKDYGSVIYRQGYAAEKMNIGALVFRRIDDLQFTVKQGYGFADASGITKVDRGPGAPDELRRDFVEGEKDAELLIEMPRGQYELLIISGDEKEESLTTLDAVGGRRAVGKTQKAGIFKATLLPIIHEEDGAVRVKISTEAGKKWKINAVLVNLYKSF